MQAVKDAEETKSKVDAEMVSLERTLTNIETARPLGELKVVSNIFGIFFSIIHGFCVLIGFSSTA